MRVAHARDALGQHEAGPQRDDRDAVRRQLVRGVGGEAVERRLADAVATCQAYFFAPDDEMFAIRPRRARHHARAPRTRDAT